MSQEQQDEHHTGERREPDYRFTLANERTFLAWMRTGLALIASAVALDQFAPDLGSDVFRDAAGIVLAALAGGVCLGGLWRWRAVQEAMARGGRLKVGGLPVLLGIGLAAISIGVLVVLLVELLG